MGKSKRREKRGHDGLGHIDGAMIGTVEDSKGAKARKARRRERANERAAWRRGELA